MLHRTAGRCIAEATALNVTSVPRSCYSTAEIKDLINEGKSRDLNRRSGKSNSSNLRSGGSKDSSSSTPGFGVLIKQLQAQAQNPAKHVTTATTPKRVRSGDFMQEAFEEDALLQRKAPGRRRPSQSLKTKATVGEEAPSSNNGDPWNMATEAARFSAPRAASMGGRQGPGRRKRGRRFGDEGEEEGLGLAADVSEKDLDTEEFWDVDADTMRAFRRLSVWRNPVIGDESGRPALFRSVKTGYELFAEERTQFKLNDTSASWAGNRPTSSSQNEVGGSGGDYGIFLPEKLKNLAGVDSTEMRPADLVSLNLALSVNLTPRERENAAATVEDILSRAQGVQQKQSM